MLEDIGGPQEAERDCETKPQNAPASLRHKSPGKRDRQGLAAAAVDEVAAVMGMAKDCTRKELGELITETTAGARRREKIDGIALDDVAQRRSPVRLMCPAWILRHEQHDGRFDIDQPPPPGLTEERSQRLMRSATTGAHLLLYLRAVEVDVIMAVVVANARPSRPGSCPTLPPSETAALVAVRNLLPTFHNAVALRSAGWVLLGDVTHLAFQTGKPLAVAIACGSSCSIPPVRNLSQKPPRTRRSGGGGGGKSGQHSGGEAYNKRESSAKALCQARGLKTALHCERVWIAAEVVQVAKVKENVRLRQSESAIVDGYVEVGARKWTEHKSAYLANT
ncbi:hypothetical protein CORC01_00073 [Colletotrichum orchidophilum]|uniref:Uncharacterized protein n=1 Tax=Colletotrichum orchidophilum TaxID=1209926 RepID=A0A1G4BT50_9PEZI|nr:uncharacterized protein CORC01_00073 [Colletotrichum orchidophilum]OHF04602.1 hypothetical protein CORC01_00073 [Colletotrichum orchidophilum]